MDKYQNYMDSAEPSTEFKQKLKGLSTPKKAPVWQKYGAMAAALVLVLGLGTWGLARRAMNDVGEIGEPVPEIGEVVAPIPEPDPMPDTQTQITTEGYEVIQGESVSYYMLPYIEYGQVSEDAKVDLALPVGVYRRDLTREELAALLDGESNLTQHLNWGDYELYAFAMLNRDGSLWQLHVEGRKGDSGYEHFALEIQPGAIPATCIVYPESAVNRIWGEEVIADGHDGKNGSARRVAFLHGDYGYRFEIYGADREAIEDITARTVRFFVLDCAPYFVPDGNSEGYTGGNMGEESTLPHDPSAGQPTETVEPDAPVPTPPPVEEWGIRISAEDVSSTGLTLVLERTAEGPQAMTGEPFRLERWSDGAWLELDTVPYEGEGVLVWTDIGWLFPDEAGGRYEHSVDWTLLYGELAPGQYRMAKDVSGAELWAEFELEE